jgi:hypothetical protein
MSFRERFRENIEAIGRRSRPELGQLVDKAVSPLQVHHQRMQRRSHSDYSSPADSRADLLASKRLDSLQAYRATPPRSLHANIPVQLLASNSLTSDTPVDFSCLVVSPFAHHRRKPISLKSRKSEGESVRYVPCRLGGLGSAFLGSSAWSKAAHQQRRRKEYGRLLRVSWQVQSQCLI